MPLWRGAAVEAAGRFAFGTAMPVLGSSKGAKIAMSRRSVVWVRVPGLDTQVALDCFSEEWSLSLETLFLYLVCGVGCES